jgi:hypothetical protein
MSVMRRVATESPTSCCMVAMAKMAGLCRWQRSQRESLKSEPPIDRRFHQQLHRAPRPLPQRNVHFEARWIRQAVELRIAGHADNGDPFGSTSVDGRPT